MGLEKGMVNIMATTHFPEKARRTLVSMRKAAMDAFVLGSLIVILLLVTGVLFTYLWLTLLIYGLVYLLVLALRFHKATFEADLVLNRDQSVEDADETLVSEKDRIGMMLSWRNAH